MIRYSFQNWPKTFQNFLTTHWLHKEEAYDLDYINMYDFEKKFGIRPIFTAKSYFFYI